MLNDPEFDKMIIYGLAGVCLVLLLAVIFLAVKRNIYYVDEEGREVPSPKQQAKRAKRLRKAAAEEPAEPEVIAAEPEVIAEPEPVLAEAEEVVEAVEPVEPAEPVFNEVPDDDIFAEAPEEGEDVTKVMRFTIDPAEEAEPVIEEAEEVIEPAAEEAPLRMISFDEEPEEEEVIVEEAEPEETAPKATGLVVTVTVAGQSETHEIDQLPCLIGREQSSCNLVISEPAVSRRHARIYVNEDGLFIEDVSEHNGTYLNGTKLPSLGSAPLKEDDRVSLGRAEIAVNRILY